MLLFDNCKFVAVICSFQFVCTFAYISFQEVPALCHFLSLQVDASLSLVGSCQACPPLIKLTSVELAIFDHFDTFGTREMLFPPSVRLHCIKTALYVKISTLLGICFSPLLSWRNYCSKRALVRGELCCRMADVCFVPFALCRMPASDNQLHLLLFGEGVPVLASHWRSPVLCTEHWCTAAVAAIGAPLHSACWAAARIPDWIRITFIPLHQDCIYTLDNSSASVISEISLLGLKGAQYTELSPGIVPRKGDQSFWLSCSWE